MADVALLERRLLPPLLRRPAVAAAVAAAPVLMLDGNLAPAALEVSWAAWAGAWHLLLGTCCLALASVAGWQASTKWSNGHRSLLLQEACRQAAAAGAPVWFEPVSAPKSTRATALLSLLSFISPNEQELAARAAGGSGAAGSGGGAGAQQHPAPAPAQMLLSLACGCTFGLGVITCTACPGMRLCGEATHCPIPRGAAGTRWGRALRWHLLALLFAASRVLRMPHFLPAVSISVRAPAPRARPGKGYHTAQSSARHHNGAGA